MKYITKAQISNRTDFLTITRWAYLLSHHIDAENESITMFTRVLYYDENGVDITPKFTSNNPSLLANNIKRKKLYEEDGVTPLYEEDGITEKTIGMYDYLIAMKDSAVKLNDLYIYYIGVNDIKGNFNNTEQ